MEVKFSDNDGMDDTWLVEITDGNNYYLIEICDDKDIVLLKRIDEKISFKDTSIEDLFNFEHNEFKRED